MMIKWSLNDSKMIIKPHTWTKRFCQLISSGGGVSTLVLFVYRSLTKRARETDDRLNEWRVSLKRRIKTVVRKKRPIGESKKKSEPMRIREGTGKWKWGVNASAAAITTRNRAKIRRFAETKPTGPASSVSSARTVIIDDRRGQVQGSCSPSSFLESLPPMLLTGSTMSCSGARPSWRCRENNGTSS